MKEHGVGISAVACRCLRFACVRLPFSGFALPRVVLPLACCDARCDSRCRLDPSPGYEFASRECILSLCEDLFQPFGVPRSQGVAMVCLCPRRAFPMLVSRMCLTVTCWRFLVLFLDGSVSSVLQCPSCWFLELRLIWRIRSPRVWLSEDRHGFMPSMLVWGMPLFSAKQFVVSRPLDVVWKRRFWKAWQGARGHFGSSYGRPSGPVRFVLTVLSWQNSLWQSSMDACCAVSAPSGTARVWESPLATFCVPKCCLARWQNDYSSSTRHSLSVGTSGHSCSSVRG